MSGIRIARWVLVVALVVSIGAAAATAGTEARPIQGPQVKEYGVGVVKFRGKGAEYWHWQFQKMRERWERDRKVLQHRGSVDEAIALASVVYGVDHALLRRKAWCESRFNPNARNVQPIYNGEHATGLFQFIPSTFASTPFARFSIYSTYANALAAGWMHANGRGGEWACR